MATNVTNASLSSSDPGETPTPASTSGSAPAATLTFLGVSSQNSSQAVVKVQTYGAVGAPRVNNGVVEISAPSGSGKMGTTSYLVVDRIDPQSENWSFDVQVNGGAAGNGGGTITFRKGNA